MLLSISVRRVYEELAVEMLHSWGINVMAVRQSGEVVSLSLSVKLETTGWKEFQLFSILVY